MIAYYDKKVKLNNPRKIRIFFIRYTPISKVLLLSKKSQVKTAQKLLRRLSQIF